MSTKTKYILQGLFFLVLSVFCLFAYITGKTGTMKNFTLSGTILSLIIGFIFLKNAFKR